MIASLAALANPSALLNASPKATASMKSMLTNALAAALAQAFALLGLRLRNNLNEHKKGCRLGGCPFSFLASLLYFYERLAPDGI